jgi:hypothetical protein
VVALFFIVLTMASSELCPAKLTMNSSRMAMDRPLSRVTFGIQ